MSLERPPITKDDFPSETIQRRRVPDCIKAVFGSSMMTIGMTVFQVGRDLDKPLITAIGVGLAGGGLQLNVIALGRLSKTEKTVRRLYQKAPKNPQV